MKTKVIKTEAEYEAALARLDEIFDAKPGTPEGDELELLSLLVESYEEAAFPLGLPDPVAAIRFRMEQQALKPKDLVPYIGSASKVSEVLSGSRTLSLSMIRGLASGLGIPTEVLVQRAGAQLDGGDPRLASHKFPIAHMLKRGWFQGFSGSLAEAKAQAPTLLATFAGNLGSGALRPALDRRTVRSGAAANDYALTAWRIRVATRALRDSLPKYRPGTVTQPFLRQLIQLSYLSAGPTLAREFLNKNGIHLVIEPHLPKTYLDGAAIRLPDSSPLVALTLRYDRLDHFWFTLAHELAHVSLHLDRNDIEAFFDDLAAAGPQSAEQEADEFAAEALIPAQKWAAAGLTPAAPKQKVIDFATQLMISPAIPAGRLRFESRNYKLLQELVGVGEVRALFQ